MKHFKKYKLYNQVTKEFDVIVMNKAEINKLDNNKQFLVLIPKKDIATSKQIKKSKQPTLREMFIDFRKEIIDLKQEISNIKQEISSIKQDVIELRTDLNQIVKLNNLKTE